MKFHHGATRGVFLVGPVAIKVPTFRSWDGFLHGLLANRQERLFSPFLRDVAPVRFSDPVGLLVVMDRCDPLPAPLSEDEMRRVCNGADSVIPAELKQSSFGMLHGRIVALDYGT